MNPIAESLNHKSLNRTLITSVVLAVVAAMTIYTLFEVLTAGSISASEIMTHHVVPTLVIGVIIWAVLTMLLSLSGDSLSGSLNGSLNGDRTFS